MRDPRADTKTTVGRSSYWPVGRRIEHFRGGREERHSGGWDGEARGGPGGIALLVWENARDLPWRRTRDPWRVLISEVMLQQIQVKRAVPFYERFLERFPTVNALTEAPLAVAIRVWEDLERYRRVVYLYKTARRLVREHGGGLPSDPEDLVKLPGTGPYTAGAMAASRTCGGSCTALLRGEGFEAGNGRGAPGDSGGAGAVGSVLAVEPGPG